MDFYEKLMRYFNDDREAIKMPVTKTVPLLPWNRKANETAYYNMYPEKNPYYKYDSIRAPLGDKMNQTMQEYARRSRPNNIEPIALRAEYYDNDMGRDYIPVYSDEDQLRLIKKEMDAQETQDYIDNMGYAVGPLGAYKGYIK